MIYGQFAIMLSCTQKLSLKMDGNDWLLLLPWCQKVKFQKNEACAFRNIDFTTVESNFNYFSDISLHKFAKFIDF